MHYLLLFATTQQLLYAECCMLYALYRYSVVGYEIVYTLRIYSLYEVINELISCSWDCD